MFNTRGYVQRMVQEKNNGICIETPIKIEGFNSNFICISGYYGMATYPITMHLINDVFLRKNIAVGYVHLQLDRFSVVKTMLFSILSKHKRPYCNDLYCNVQVVEEKLNQIKNHLFITTPKIWSFVFLKKSCSTMVKENNVKVIVIDSVTMLKKMGGKHWERGLNTLAIELGVTFILNESYGIGFKNAIAKELKPSEVKAFDGLAQLNTRFITTYRPSYFRVNTWEDETSCEKQIKMLFYENNEKTSEQILDFNLVKLIVNDNFLI